ncbi:MAG: hypothetical protein ACYDC2_06915 [Solirubrobacteraceae bacterium]
MSPRARPRQRAALAAALLASALPLAAAGCGGVQPGRPTGSAARAAAGGLAAARPGAAPGAATYPSAASGAGTPARARDPHGVVAKIDVSSDRIVAEGKVHIAAGAPSDAEVKREIEAARKAGVTLPQGESAQSFEAAGQQAAGAGTGASTPVTPWNPRSKPIADWIIPILQWASEHGWSGTVTSGYRTFYEQAQLNAAGAFSAAAGLSNHETTKYPGGAVDVTAPAQLLAVLTSYPGQPKLVGGALGPADPEHFSATGT